MIGTSFTPESGDTSFTFTRSSPSASGVFAYLAELIRSRSRSIGAKARLFTQKSHLPSGGTLGSPDISKSTWYAVMISLSVSPRIAVPASITLSFEVKQVIVPKLDIIRLYSSAVIATPSKTRRSSTSGVKLPTNPAGCPLALSSASPGSDVDKIAARKLNARRCPIVALDASTA